MQTPWMMHVPVISTGHIDLETSIKMRCASSYWFGIEGGWMLPIDQLEKLEGFEGQPQCLKDIATWANKRDFGYVRLDQDADAVADLPTYDR